MNSFNLADLQNNEISLGKFRSTVNEKIFGIKEDVIDRQEEWVLNAMNDITKWREMNRNVLKIAKGKIVEVCYFFSAFYKPTTSKRDNVFIYLTPFGQQQLKDFYLLCVSGVHFLKIPSVICDADYKTFDLGFLFNESIYKSYVIANPVMCLVDDAVVVTIPLLSQKFFQAKNFSYIPDYNHILRILTDES